MDAKKTGELIAAMRKQKGMNQRQLAEKLGVTNKAISRWETGRGYPDVETLPELARVLDLSVQELLDGEQHLDQTDLIAVEQSLVCVCHSAGQQKRKLTRKNKILVAILIILLLFWLAPRIADAYHFVIGSNRCIVAADYGSLAFCGKQYVPLFTDGYECSIGACLVNEASVTGSNFFMKLLFGESLHEVKGVPDYELVYLQTDYDRVPSNYYVLAAKYDQYYAMLTNGDYGCYYTEVFCDDGCMIQMRLDDDAVRALEFSAELPCEYQPDLGNNSVRILQYEENHVFYRFAGELVCDGQIYYWCPSVYSGGFNAGCFLGNQYYLIPQQYADYLEALLCFE